MITTDFLHTAVGADALAASLRTDVPRRVLIALRSHVGDAVMSTGAVHAVIDRFPGAHITLETSRRAMPIFDNIAGIASRRIRRDHWEKTTTILWLRWSRRFDLTVILDDSRRRARMARWGGVRRIVGVREDEQDARFTASVLWNADGHDLFDSLRSVLALIGAGGDVRPRLVTDDRARSDAQRVLPPASDRSLVGLFVDAASENKRWPLERFVNLGERLTSAGCDVLAIAGLEGAPLLDPFRAQGFRTAADVRHPLTLAEVIRGCAALVTNDTSAAHLADAVGTPAVVLYGPTLPRRFAPFSGGHRLLHGNFGCDLYLRRCDAERELGRGHCDHRCMRAIGVDEVYDAALALIRMRSQSVP